MKQQLKNTIKKGLHFLLWLIVFQSYTAEANDYFDTQYSKAVEYVFSNINSFSFILTGSPEEKAMMAAIVFPEIMRYSMVKDLVETTALKTLYVQHGLDAVDFSIGRFQMKPSFIETLEDKVKTYNLEDKYGYIDDYPCKNTEEIRAERVKRMSQPHWQLNYLQCFYDLASKRFSRFRFATESSRLNFYATAYNYNFLAPVDEILSWVHVKAFPYGQKRHSPYAYADVSLRFYQEYKQELIQIFTIKTHQS